jgi:hypothetical protein
MKYVVSLLAFLLLLTLQTPRALANGFVRGGPHFVSRPVIIINPNHARFVRVRPFGHHVIILPRHHFMGNPVIIREPFFCFHHGIGFTNQPAFFDHLHRFDGVAFETIPSAIVPHGSQMFFFGN